MKRIALILISLLLLLLMGCGQEEPSTIDLSDYEHLKLLRVLLFSKVHIAVTYQVGLIF